MSVSASRKEPRQVAARTLLVLGVVGYPLVAFLPPLLNVPETAVFSVPFRLALLLLSVVVVVRWGVGPLRVSFLYVTSFALFWGLYLLRLAADAPPDAVLLRLPWWEYWVWAIGVCALPAVAALTLPPRLHPGSAYRWLLLGLALAAAGNSAVMLDALMRSDLQRLAHFALNPISVGHLGASLALMCLAGIGDRAAVSPSGRYPLREWLVLPSLLLLGLLLLTASASRGPLLAFLLAGGLLPWRYLRRTAFREAIRTAVVLGVVAVGTAALPRRTAGELPSRIRSLVHGQDVTLSMRLERWQLSWREFLDHPVLGGSLEISHLDYPHNVVIEAFMATGIVGGLLFTTILVLGVAKSLRLVGGDGPQWWLGLLTLQFLVGSLFSGTIYSNAQMWFLLGLGVAATSGTGIAERGRVQSSDHA